MVNGKDFYRILLNDIIKEISNKYAYSLIDENLINDIKSSIVEYVEEKYNFKLDEKLIKINFDGNNLIIDINVYEFPQDIIDKIISLNLEKFI